MVKYLTSEGLEKLKKELDYLENAERKKIAQRLTEAIAQGDLSENAGYQVTKDNQFFLEKRIKELRQTISNAKVLEKPKGSVISLGSFASLSSKNGTLSIQIVSPEEADVFQGKVSFESPLGGAILGKKKGDKVQVETLEGKDDYRIVEVK